MHIRQVLVKAELEKFQQYKDVYNELRKGKLCFSCRTKRFSFFNRSYTCQFCKRPVCSQCCKKERLPLTLSRCFQERLPLTLSRCFQERLPLTLSRCFQERLPLTLSRCFQERLPLTLSRCFQERLPLTLSRCFQERLPLTLSRCFQKRLPSKPYANLSISSLGSTTTILPREEAGGTSALDTPEKPSSSQRLRRTVSRLSKRKIERSSDELDLPKELTEDWCTMEVCIDCKMFISEIISSSKRSLATKRAHLKRKTQSFYISSANTDYCRPSERNVNEV
ncbi:protein spire homolog 1-like [Oncorhynchus mykiss]|uniref:protein spire homolog 1-like n=1 Tax=Oncorhynchus mykiss TaxID=8022 RepID=UPI001878C39A|nr:protein spire homolog 1-like [Oncorhynchus mykiss]